MPNIDIHLVVIRETKLMRAVCMQLPQSGSMTKDRNPQLVAWHVHDDRAWIRFGWRLACARRHGLRDDTAWIRFAWHVHEDLLVVDMLIDRIINTAWKIVIVWLHWCLIVTCAVGYY